MDVTAVGEDHVCLVVDFALLVGVGDDRRLLPVGSLEVVVAAQRVRAPNRDVGVAQALALVAYVVRASGLLDARRGLERRVEHLQRHVDRAFGDFPLARRAGGGKAEGRRRWRGGAARATVVAVTLRAR